MLNKAILMGRLTADPELRKTSGDVSVTTFTLAVNRSFTRQGEQAQTDFIDIVAWRNTAEFAAKWFQKGMQVAVSGKIQTRTWEDKQGNKRKSVEVVADEVFFADSKRGDAPARDSMMGEPFDLGRAPASAFPMPEDDSDLPF
ncbi:MAG: single-stranded DNA-binding protein [Clostridia bacterium]|nr:single-stranded DNA-binding protein [Clostridia bacterium]MBR4955556.1 single-stranded DNA-binding protein [Clostridia bacterium]MBR5903565.1 single-stranded DNA-binding protein [Clostridia bacterium]